MQRSRAVSTVETDAFNMDFDFADLLPRTQPYMTATRADQLYQEAMQWLTTQLLSKWSYGRDYWQHDTRS